MSTDPRDLFSLDGKHALVTGSSRGIGRAIALGFARAGADVALLSRSKAELDDVAAEVRARGRRASVVVADILNEDCAADAGKATGQLGGCDILVNCAGQSKLKDPFLEVSMDEWSQAHDLLLLAHVRVTQAIARQMASHGRGGAIINISSIFGHRGAPGAERELGSVTYYTSAKHALIGLTRALAIELATENIRVNALSPGWIDTPMNPFDAAKPAFIDWNLPQIPMGRWGQESEMIGPAIFLASAAASFMTGQSLVVDGGHIA